MSSYHVLREMDCKPKSTENKARKLAHSKGLVMLHNTAVDRWFVALVSDACPIVFGGDHKATFDEAYTYVKEYVG